MGRRPAIQGRFVFGAGSEVSGGTLRARTEVAGLLSIGGKLLASTQRFSPRHGLGVARARVEDHLPQPGFERVAPLFGQNGEVAQGDVPVDALVDAVELVGTLQGQDPPPAGFGLDRPGGPKISGTVSWPAWRQRFVPTGGPRSNMTVPDTFPTCAPFLLDTFPAVTPFLLPDTERPLLPNHVTALPPRRSPRMRLHIRAVLSIVAANISRSAT
jgi:hypothetical protein